MSDELKACPFCGFLPTVEPWHGGPKTKHAVHCDNDACVVGPMTTGATKGKAIERWNRRPRVPEVCVPDADTLRAVIRYPGMRTFIGTILYDRLQAMLAAAPAVPEAGDCPMCKGSGEVTVYIKSAFEQDGHKDTISCPACKGTGTSPASRRRCRRRI